MEDREFEKWTEFDGKKSGRSYYIRTARTVKDREEITRGMIEHFLREEPTCKYLKCYEDSDFINELKTVWKDCLEENLSLVCMTDEAEPKFAGFILLCRSSKDANEEEKLDLRNEKWAKIINIMEYVSSESKVYEKLNLNEYLADLGMLVFPQFRGEGIAEKLLNTCNLVCQSHKLAATVITFSSYMSQLLAKKLGWEELYSISYAELRKIDEVKYGIDNIEEHTKEIKYMYKI